MAQSMLRQFMLRSAVLQLYRDLHRVVRSLPPHTRGPVRHEVRAEFEQARTETDSEQINFLLSQGRKKLADLRQMVALVS